MELVNTGIVKELYSAPYTINPLAVGKNNDKLRLILDFKARQNTCLQESNKIWGLRRHVKIRWEWMFDIR